MLLGSDENNEFAEWFQQWRREVQSRAPVEDTHPEDKHLPDKMSFFKPKAIIDGAVPTAINHETDGTGVKNLAAR
jgi:hypothetical protein